jgi:hypothetical protein
MNAWPYVLAAYAVSLGGTAIVALLSWRAMRRAEKSDR